jgi:hypothetical protein
MSEHSPEKQRKYQPLKDNCDTCSKEYPITSENGQVFHHAEQPELDHILCQCPYCDSRFRIFIGEDTLESAAHFKLPFTVEKYGSDDIHERWIQANGYKVPQTYELTPRHDALVAKFGENLMAMPPELFWDNIEGETGHPYPETWI